LAGFTASATCSPSAVLKAATSKLLSFAGFGLASTFGFSGSVRLNIAARPAKPALIASVTLAVSAAGSISIIVSCAVEKTLGRDIAANLSGSVPSDAG